MIENKRKEDGGRRRPQGPSLYKTSTRHGTAEGRAPSDDHTTPLSSRTASTVAGFVGGALRGSGRRHGQVRPRVSGVVIQSPEGHTYIVLPYSIWSGPNSYPTAGDQTARVPATRLREGDLCEDVILKDVSEPARHAIAGLYAHVGLFRRRASPLWLGCTLLPLLKSRNTWVPCSATWRSDGGGMKSREIRFGTPFGIWTVRISRARRHLAGLSTDRCLAE